MAARVTKDKWGVPGRKWGQPQHKYGVVYVAYPGTIIRSGGRVYFGDTKVRQAVVRSSTRR